MVSNPTRAMYRTCIQKDIPPQQGLKHQQCLQYAGASMRATIQKDIPPQQGLKLRTRGASAALSTIQKDIPPQQGLKPIISRISTKRAFSVFRRTFHHNKD